MEPKPIMKSIMKIPGVELNHLEFWLAIRSSPSRLAASDCISEGRELCLFPLFERSFFNA